MSIIYITIADNHFSA